MLFLILASLFVGIIFLIAFLWAVRSGQMEDLYTPAVRLIIEEESPSPKPERTPHGS